MGNGISKTAYFTLACRFWDAQKPKPACNDTLARIFMEGDEEARKIGDLFKEFTFPVGSVPVRHQMIDEFLLPELKKNPNLLVVNIGCGFDTRAFRHSGGRWVEIDEPAIIELKNSRLPAKDAKNELTRISIDFSRETLKEKLASFQTNDFVVVIAEGVLFYLEEPERRSLLQTVKELFPHHLFLCDTMTQAMVTAKASTAVKFRAVLNAMNAPLKGSDTIEELFHGFGYKTKDRIRVMLRMAEQGAIPTIPGLFVKYILKTLREGLLLWAFETKP
jgi:methyltransferase (TIGR00027 family)